MLSPVSQHFKVGYTNLSLLPTQWSYIVKQRHLSHLTIRWVSKASRYCRWLHQFPKYHLLCTCNSSIWLIQWILRRDRRQKRQCNWPNTSRTFSTIPFHARTSYESQYDCCVTQTLYQPDWGAENCCHFCKYCTSVSGRPVGTSWTTSRDVCSVGWTSQAIEVANAFPLQSGSTSTLVLILSIHQAWSPIDSSYHFGLCAEEMVSVSTTVG